MPIDKGAKGEGFLRPTADKKGKSTTLSSFILRPKPTAAAAAAPSSSAYPSSDPFEPLPQSSRPLPLPAFPSKAPRILAVEIPPNVLRPIAFRIFTKKHNLTLKSEALVALCSFIGRRCGADWRDSGNGEKLLDEIARQWKRNEGSGGILVDGGEGLKSVLRGLEIDSRGGGGSAGGGAGMLVRESSFDLGAGVPSTARVMGEEELEIGVATQDLGDDIDPRAYLKIVDAFRQPKYSYNFLKKQYEKAPKPSLFPPPQSKTQLFKSRYNILHARLLRNESFLPPTFSTSTSQKSYYKLTPISNLLGRSSQPFLLFGMLSISPSGLLTLLDTTGEIILDLSLASAVPEDGAWFAPGGFAIVDGVYEEDGRFSVFTVGQPPPERRDASAEVFGHIDFLGNNVSLDMSAAGGGQVGRAMRKVEKGLGAVRWLFLGEVRLDEKGTLEGLRRVFEEYVDDPPMVVALCGNFCGVAMGTGGESVGYKENFDRLASLLSDFPSLTTASTFIFIPGDNDPWASTFSGGSSTILPRKPIPEVFTSRIKRVFQQSNKESSSGKGEVHWMSNPCRIGYFTQEVVVCRDDVLNRLQRSGIRFKASSSPAVAVAAAVAGKEKNASSVAGVEADGGGDDDEEMSMQIDPESQPPEPEVDIELKSARKLVKTILDQAYLSPFPLNTRPVLWDFSHTLQLYPLPSALVLSDPRAQPFAVTYEGCHVMNPGKMVERRKVARWVEYRPAEGRGVVREVGF